MKNHYAALKVIVGMPLVACQSLMVNFLLLIFILLICESPTFSQQTVVGNTPSDPDRANELKDLLNSQFTQIVTVGSVSSFGNYAALSSTNESIKISGSIVDKKSNVFNVDVSGGASEGILTVFNNTKLNPNFGFGITYNKLLLKPGTFIARNVILRDSYTNEKEEVERSFKKKMNEINTRKELFNLYESKNKFTIELKKLDSLCKIKDCNKVILKPQMSKEDIELATLKSNSASKENELKDIDNKIQDIEKDIEEYFEIEKLKASNEKNLKIQSINEKIKSMPITKINISWLSVGYKYNNNSFNLFDATKPLSEQIKNMNFSTEEFFFSVSHFNSDTDDKKYISYGVKYAITNNLEDLSKTEIQDITPVGGSTVRSTTVKKTAYTGEYKENTGRFTIFLDSYFFVGNKNNSSIAIHLNPQLVKIGDLASVTSLKLGIFMPFKDSKKVGSVVNLEVFLKLNNLFNRPSGADSIFSNNSFGIQATFPFGTFATF